MLSFSLFSCWWCWLLVVIPSPHFTSSSSLHHHIPPIKKVVVLGGGVGGLVTSTLLSRSNGGNTFDVHLLEKQGQCGGRMDSDEICVGTTDAHTYRFDRGPSLLLLPDVYTKTFALLGEKLSDHVHLLPVEPLYRCYFEEDGTIAEISMNATKMATTANALEGKHGYDSFVSYMKIAGDFLRFGLPTVIEEQPAWKYLGSFLLACIRAFPLWSHDTMLRSFFQTSKMRALMSFQDLYIGLSPYEAPAVFALLQALELERGIYYPKGGFGSVARALERIARNNHVHIETNCTLQTIHTSSSSSQNVIDSVTVITTNGTQQQIHGDIFVTNIDAPAFEQTFVGSSKSGVQQDQQTANGRPSCGIVSFNFAFNKELQCLSHHTLYLSKSYQSSWKVVEEPNDAVFDPQKVNFYVHAPSRTESNGTVCPLGHDSITVLVPVPPLPITTTTTATLPGYDLAVCRATVLQKLQEMEDAASLRSGKGIPAMRVVESIVAERIREPIQWKEDFGLFRGSAFGLAHSLNQLSIFRARLRHPFLKNLYRVGASTRPGNGVPLVMIGARLTAEAVLSDNHLDNPPKGPI